MSLQVITGAGARDALVAACDSARSSITVEYHSLWDADLIAHLNAAAARGVRVHVALEARPDRYAASGAESASRDRHTWQQALCRRFSPLVDLRFIDDAALLHDKVAVFDERVSAIETANATASGFSSPGNVLVLDDDPTETAALSRALDHHASVVAGDVIASPSPALRERVEQLFRSSGDLRVASEDLSDREILNALERRHLEGHVDRVLVNGAGGQSATQRRAIDELAHAGVAIRSLAPQFFHAKYVDGGDRIYVGSANLTRNGLDEAREVGVCAAAARFADGGAQLRRTFDEQWSRATPASGRSTIARVVGTAVARFAMWPLQLLARWSLATQPSPRT